MSNLRMSVAEKLKDIKEQIKRKGRNMEHAVFLPSQSLKNDSSTDFLKCAKTIKNTPHLNCYVTAEKKKIPNIIKLDNSFSNEGEISGVEVVFHISTDTKIKEVINILSDNNEPI